MFVVLMGDSPAIANKEKLMRCPICDRFLLSKSERERDLCSTCKEEVNEAVYEMEQDDCHANVPDKFVVREFDEEEEENG